MVKRHFYVYSDVVVSLCALRCYAVGYSAHAGNANLSLAYIISQSCSLYYSSPIYIVPIKLKKIKHLSACAIMSSWIILRY